MPSDSPFSRRGDPCGRPCPVSRPPVGAAHPGGPFVLLCALRSYGGGEPPPYVGGNTGYRSNPSGVPLIRASVRTGPPSPEGKALGMPSDSPFSRRGRTPGRPFVLLCALRTCGGGEPPPYDWGIQVSALNPSAFPSSAPVCELGHGGLSYQVQQKKKKRQCGHSRCKM